MGVVLTECCYYKLTTGRTEGARVVAYPNAPPHAQLMLLSGRLENHLIYESGVTTDHKNHILFYPHHHTHWYSHRPQYTEPEIK
jgi:hypothetical protein